VSFKRSDEDCFEFLVSYVLIRKSKQSAGSFTFPRAQLVCVEGTVWS
jgi:hypothetical protein